MPNIFSVKIQKCLKMLIKTEKTVKYTKSALYLCIVTKHQNKGHTFQNETKTVLKPCEKFEWLKIKHRKLRNASLRRRTESDPCDNAHVSGGSVPDDLTAARLQSDPAGGIQHEAAGY